MTHEKTQIKQSTVIDTRGPRFSAAITTAVLATALATNNVWVVIAQAIVFAIGAFRGPQFTPYAAIFKSCLLYTSPSPRDRTRSRMPSSA